MKYHSAQHHEMLPGDARHPILPARDISLSRNLQVTVVEQIFRLVVEETGLKGHMD
jgi:hypothetical protein